MKKIYVLKRIFILLISITVCAALPAQNFNLIDINKLKNSYPSNNEYSPLNMFTDLNGKFYFSADDGIHGTELFSTDGTSARTKLVKDLVPGRKINYRI
jgi:ELWxxDGT repeat protein